MARNRTAVRTAIIVVVVLILAAALLYVYMLLNAGETTSAHPARPENVAYGDEAVAYEEEPRT